jgi:hypothetical protein
MWFPIFVKKHVLLTYFLELMLLHYTPIYLSGIRYSFLLVAWETMCRRNTYALLFIAALALRTLCFFYAQSLIPTYNAGWYERATHFLHLPLFFTAPDLSPGVMLLASEYAVILWLSSSHFAVITVIQGSFARIRASNFRVYQNRYKK